MPTGPSVTLHVGQFKTATTSLQAALHDSRGSLEQIGVRYRPGSGQYHAGEAFDLLRQDAAAAYWRSAAFRHMVTVALADGRPYWAEFAAAARSHPGRTLLSAEPLSMAGPAVGEQAARDLAGLPVRVVVTTRAVSRLLPSAYGEWAKRFVLPDLETFVRAVLRSLLDDGHSGRHAWMRPDAIRAAWQPIATDGWHEIALDDASIDGYQEAYWRAMGIEALPAPALQKENQSLPYGALLAWQSHLRSGGPYDPRVDGGTMTALVGVNVAVLTAPRGRVRLDTDVARLVDAAFPIDPEAGPLDQRALDALRERLGRPEPLTAYEPIGDAHTIDAEVAYWSGVLDRRRRTVRTRIAVARRLGVRRRRHPDWDRFRDEAPDLTAEFVLESGG